MIRILQVYPQLNNAGTERVIMNLYENMDLTIIQFDFLVERPGELDEKIKKMGGIIHYLTSDSDYESKLLTFFGNHREYQIVHTHTHGKMGKVLKAARKSGITCRIAHSHNARNDLPKIMTFIKGLISLPIEYNANYFMACSTNAAKWLFPHKCKDCKIVYNGINMERYMYQKEKRDHYRQILGIKPEENVIIHVGRFAKQKNHERLIRIFECLVKEEKCQAKLLLVGTGPLKNDIENLVKKLDLKEHVFFLGNRSDVESLLSASDMFLFPSLHEGLGIVVIEAQTAGLPCLVSDAVPEEADLKLNILYRYSLQQSEKQWCLLIKSILKEKKDRNVYRDKIMYSNYNIKKIATQMQEFYLDKSGR